MDSSEESCIKPVVNNMVLPALRYIASEQVNAIEVTKKKVSQLLDYLSTKPGKNIRYYVSSGVVLTINSDALYLGESHAYSHVAG